MGNYEIFSQTNGVIFTLFALGCLLLSGLISAKDDKLFSPIKCLVVAFIFDFIGTWLEARAVTAFEQWESIEIQMMFELLMFLIFMIMTSSAASAFISGTSRKSSFNLLVWILGGLGGGAVVLFTIVIPSGDMVNNMRLIFPLAAFLYLSVGLRSKQSSLHHNGYKMAFLISSSLAVNIVLRFFTIYTPWYFPPMFYLLLLNSFVGKV